MTEKPTKRWFFGHSCFTRYSVATYIRCGGLSA